MKQLARICEALEQTFCNVHPTGRLSMLRVQRLRSDLPRTLVEDGLQACPLRSERGAAVLKPLLRIARIITEASPEPDGHTDVMIYLGPLRGIRVSGNGLQAGPQLTHDCGGGE